MTPEWEEIRRQVLRRDGHQCIQCRANLREDGAHVHHLLPRASGGSDEPANLVSLCPMSHAAVHPHLGVGLARRLLQRVAVRLAEWLDTEGHLARQTRNFGPALKLFGLDAFRPAQIDVVEAALQGRSLLLISPTGSGKSLSFQLPAVLGVRRGDFADASLDTSSIAFVIDCQVWSNNSVRVTARNVSASTVDLAAAPLSLQVAKRRIP